MKGRYFVFQNVPGQVIIFIPPEFEAEMVTVSPEDPLKVQDKALQVKTSLFTENYINTTNIVILKLKMCLF